MRSGRKHWVIGFRKLASAFQGLIPGVPDRPIEDVAMDYRDYAREAGELLVAAYDPGLLARIPGLAKLMERKMEPARLFRQFHGYEVNAAVLLPVPPGEGGPGSLPLTCGLLPQLLADHPVFRRQVYRGNNPDAEAMVTELHRAAEACNWLCEVIGAGGRKTTAKARLTKRPTPRALADFAHKRRNGKAVMAWSEIAQQWFAKHPEATTIDGNPLTWRHFYHAWKRHFGDSLPKEAGPSLAAGKPPKGQRRRT